MVCRLWLERGGRVGDRRRDVNTTHEEELSDLERTR
jgi:hypothetical protein